MSYSHAFSGYPEHGHSSGFLTKTFGNNTVFFFRQPLNETLFTLFPVLLRLNSKRDIPSPDPSTALRMISGEGTEGRG
jgi:hypothetical protein